MKHCGVTVPVPVMVFTETEYGMAYGWKCENADYIVFGNTRAEAQAEFMKTIERETGRTA